jgi:hypothetical protein
MTNAGAVRLLLYLATCNLILTRASTRARTH